MYHHGERTKGLRCLDPSVQQPVTHFEKTAFLQCPHSLQLSQDAARVLMFQNLKDLGGIKCASLFRRSLLWFVRSKESLFNSLTFLNESICIIDAYLNTYCEHLIPSYNQSRSAFCGGALSPLTLGEGYSITHQVFRKNKEIKQAKYAAHLPCLRC